MVLKSMKIWGAGKYGDILKFSKTCYVMYKAAMLHVATTFVLHILLFNKMLFQAHLKAYSHLAELKQRYAVKRLVLKMLF